MREKRSARSLYARRRGLTLLDLLALQFVIFVPLFFTVIVTTHYGSERGFLVGFISSIACWGVVGAFSGWSYYRYQEQLRVLSTNYPSIFQIKEIPSDTSQLLIAEGAKIEIGDYGWEAEPLHDDGLIYLHGLNEKWGVVWYRGFRPNQIEKVGPKPRTQYLLPESWYRGGPDAFPCPFPIQSQTADLGMPVCQSAVSVRLRLRSARPHHGSYQRPGRHGG